MSFPLPLISLKILHPLSLEPPQNSNVQSSDIIKVSQPRVKLEYYLDLQIIAITVNVMVNISSRINNAGLPRTLFIELCGHASVTQEQIYSDETSFNIAE